MLSWSEVDLSAKCSSHRSESRKTIKTNSFATAWRPISAVHPHHCSEMMAVLGLQPSLPPFGNLTVRRKRRSGVTHVWLRDWFPRPTLLLLLLSGGGRGPRVDAVEVGSVEFLHITLQRSLCIFKWCLTPSVADSSFMSSDRSHLYVKRSSVRRRRMCGALLARRSVCYGSPSLPPKTNAQQLRTVPHTD